MFALTFFVIRDATGGTLLLLAHLLLVEHLGVDEHLVLGQDTAAAAQHFDNTRLSCRLVANPRVDNGALIASFVDTGRVAGAVELVTELAPVEHLVRLRAVVSERAASALLHARDAAHGAQVELLLVGERGAKRRKVQSTHAQLIGVVGVRGRRGTRVEVVVARELRAEHAERAPLARAGRAHEDEERAVEALVLVLESLGVLVRVGDGRVQLEEKDELRVTRVARQVNSCSTLVVVVVVVEIALSCWRLGSRKVGVVEPGRLAADLARKEGAGEEDARQRQLVRVQLARIGVVDEADVDACRLLVLAARLNVRIVVIIVVRRCFIDALGFAARCLARLGRHVFVLR